MIYFIKQQRNKAVRIDIATDIEIQIQELQAGSSQKLIPIKIIRTENDQIVRKKIYTFFKDLRSGKSAWFYPDKAMQIFLKDLTSLEDLNSPKNYHIDDIIYHTADIIYRLSLAKESVNKFKIKIDINFIRQKMRILKYTQSDLAKEINLTRQSISLLLKTQQTSLFTMQKIAVALKSTTEEIVLNGSKYKA